MTTANHITKTTAHHITNENIRLLKQEPKNSHVYRDMLEDEREVEGETILLGREEHIKRIKTLEKLVEKENQQNKMKWLLLCEYIIYQEALEKYDEKEEIKYKKDDEKSYIIDEEFGIKILNPHYGGIGKWYKLKAIRDKKFKKKWTEKMDEVDRVFSHFKD